MPLIEEGLAPFDQLIVDLLDDLSAEGVIAPVRECEPSAERRFITPHRAVDLLGEVWKNHDGFETSGKVVDQMARGVYELIIKRFSDRATEPLSQTSAQDGRVRNGVSVEEDSLIDGQRFERVIEMVRLYATGSEELPIDMAGQITVSTQELLPTPNRLFKRKILDTM
jgi:hypothetical protein